MLIKRVPWKVQPQTHADVDRSNPLTRGLVYLRVPNRRPVVGNQLTQSGAVGLTPTRDGLANTFSSSYLQETVSVSLPFTLGVIAYVTSTGSSQTLLSAGNTGTGFEYWQLGINSGGTIRAATRNGTYFAANTSNAVTANVPFLAAAIYESTTSRRAFLNGSLSAAETSSSSLTGNAMRVGTIARDTPIDNLTGGTVLEARWDRALSADELASWYRNPWQLFAPRSIWVPVSVGGGSAVNAELGTASAIGYDAGVNVNRTVAASLGTATASGFIATVGQNTSIAASLGTAAALGYDAAVGTSTVVSAALGTAAALGYDAFVSNGSVISANLGTATALGYDATVGSSTTISASLGTAAALGYDADVSNGYGYIEIYVWRRTA